MAVWTSLVGEGKSLLSLCQFVISDPNIQGLAGAAPVSLASSQAAQRPTKQTLILDLLKRDGGARLVELAAATGWLPHTARAALTGLRKKDIRSSLKRQTASPATTSRRKPDHDEAR
jgi:hypothetical protein